MRPGFVGVLFFGLCAAAAGRALAGDVAIANPASVNCASLGGKLEIRQEASGQVGYCHLPDGRVIEEWTLFREKR